MAVVVTTGGSVDGAAGPRLVRPALHVRDRSIAGDRMERLCPTPVARRRNRRRLKSLRNMVAAPIRQPIGRDGQLGLRPARLQQTARSEEHTSELQSLLRTSYAAF